MGTAYDLAAFDAGIQFIGRDEYGFLQAWRHAAEAVFFNGSLSFVKTAAGLPEM